MNLRINELRHENAPTIDIVLGDRIPDNAPTRTYNLPTATEVAAIIIGSIEEGEAGNDSRSISVQLNGGGTQRLKTSSERRVAVVDMCSQLLQKQATLILLGGRRKMRRARSVLCIFLTITR